MVTKSPPEPCPDATPDGALRKTEKPRERRLVRRRTGQDERSSEALRHRVRINPRALLEKGSPGGEGLSRRISKRFDWAWPDRLLR